MRIARPTTLALGLLAACLASSGPLPALAQPAPDAATVQREAQALLDRLPATGPGVAVLVARGDAVLFRAARGMASIELGVPLTPENSFRIGSVTKQFAAAALLQRVDAGALSLADPLAKFLPDFPNAANITVAQLLNHTSGVKSYTGIPGYMDGPIRQDLSTTELVAVFRDKPVDFLPGVAFAYNNSGYVLVGAVLEAVTKQPWHAAVGAMLQPLGLASTAYGDTRKVVRGMADGYGIGADGNVVRAGYLSMTQPHAAGALVSTVDDLWRWNRALHGGKVLSAASYQRMTTPEGAAVQGAGGYGFGIVAGKFRGEPLLQHGGGIHGFTSSLMYLPRQQLTVVVLRNSDGPGLPPELLARQLAAVALGKPYPDGPTATVPREQMQALQGVWRKVGTQGQANERVLRVQGGVLTSQRSGGPVLPLRPLSASTWLFENSTSRIEVEPGTPLRLRLVSDDVEENWERTGDLPAGAPVITLSAAQQQALVGEYSSPQFSFKVFVDAQGVLRGQAPGQPALQLYATTPRSVFVREVDARVEFEPADGPVQQATLIQGPAKLPMQRKPAGQ
jgi:CubicO group peptidase (beta-lactamase class C family)